MTAPFVFRTSISFLVACLAADFALTDSAVIVPIRLLEHFPVFSANIGGEPVLLQFDSGNSGSVALTQAVIDKLKAIPTGEFSQGIVPGGNTDSGRCLGTAVPFLQEWHGEPATKADIDLGSLMMWWGAPVSMISKSFAEENGSHQSAGTLTLKHLTLSGTDFGPLNFRIEELSLPPGFGGFIGYNFFAHHVVCLDFPRNQVLIQR